MTEQKPTYEELARRCQEAEAMLAALRTGQADTLLSEEGALVVRLAEAEHLADHVKAVLLTVRHVNQLIVAETDAEQLIQRVCTALATGMGYVNAWAALVDAHGEVTSTAMGQANHACTALAAQLREGRFTACMRETFNSAALVVIDHPEEHCPDCPLADEYKNLAAFSRRLHFAGRLYGILSVSVPAGYAENAEEQDLFRELADDLSFGLHKISVAKELGASEKRYREIFEGSRDGFVMVDAAGRFLDANKAFCSMLGYTLEELRELENFYRITPARWHAWEAEAIWEGRLLREGFSGVYEKEYIRKDGTVFPVELCSYLVRRADGGIDYLWGTARDISARKEAEGHLADERQRLAFVIEASGLGTWEWNTQSNETVFNEAWAAMLGYRLEELTPTNLETWRRLAHPADLEKATGLLQRCVSGELSDYACEVRMKHRAGHWVWVMDRGRVMTRDAQGRPLLMFGIHLDITAHKRRDMALAEEKRYLEKILQTAGDGFLLLDKGGVLVDVNAAYCAMSGYTRKELLGRRISELDALEAPAETGRRIERLMASGAETFETLHQRKDGSVFPVEVTSSFVADRGGMFVAFCRDLTERKAQEEESRLLSAVTANISDSIVITDEAYAITYINKAGEALFGYSLAELRGKQPELFNADTDASVTQAAIYAKLSKGEVWIGEIPNQRKDGSRFICESKIMPLRTNAGKVYAYVGLQRDVTERKRAEEALKASESKWRNILVNTPQIGVALDPEARIVFANVHFLELTGWREEEVLGADWFDRFIPEAVRAEVREVFAHAIHLEDTAAFSSYENEILTRSGARRLVSWSNVLSKDAAGKMLEVTCLGIDLTERKAAEAEREKMAEQVRQAQKMESIGRLAGGVAHDFNNMLGVILGQAEVALEETAAEGPVHLSLMEIRKAAQRSANLTRQLLGFARRQTVSPKVLDINETITGMLSMLRRLIGEDVDLVWQPGVRVWQVRIDPSQVDQILANLCVNARDAISGVGEIRITTENRLLEEAFCAAHTDLSLGEYVLIRVRDTGRGMDAATLANIFEPFFTTKGVGEGTGLGLSTVYGIVHQNKGGVTVSSKPGHGTTFEIYLPRHQGEAPLRNLDSMGGPALKGRETILVVEDEGALLDLCKALLERLGYRVLSASSPSQALTLAAAYSEPIDLLMTDVIMPEMSGRDLAEQLLRLHPEMKQLFMSGYPANIIADQGLLGEGVHFLSKPFGKGDLSNKVRETLEG